MAATVAGILLTGNHASRPTSGVSVGTLYSCTTHSLVYQTSDTGSTWATWATLGTGTSTTTMANDTLWAAAGDIAVATGNDAAGVLSIGAAGAELARINGAVAWNAGTSFPASKATNDRYWRTDLGMGAYWDGTRWVSTILYREAMPTTSNLQSGETSDNQDSTRWTTWHTTYDLWLVSWYCTTLTLATNDGTHYWTLTLAKIDTANSASTITSVNTSADTNTTWVSRKTDIGALLGTTNRSLKVNLTKTSTPGAIYSMNAIAYRLVLT